MASRVKYRCRRCDQVGRRYQVHSHILKIHVPVERVPFYCLLCQFRCEDQNTLLDHLQNYKRHRDAVARSGPSDLSKILMKSTNPWFISDHTDMELLTEVGLSEDEMEDHRVPLQAQSLLQPITGLSTSSCLPVSHTFQPIQVPQSVPLLYGSTDRQGASFGSVVSSVGSCVEKMSPLPAFNVTSASVCQPTPVKLLRTSATSTPCRDEIAVQPALQQPLSVQDLPSNDKPFFAQRLPLMSLQALNGPQPTLQDLVDPLYELATGTVDAATSTEPPQEEPEQAWRAVVAAIQEQTQSFTASLAKLAAAVDENTKSVVRMERRLTDVVRHLESKETDGRHGVPRVDRRKRDDTILKENKL